MPTWVRLSTFRLVAVALLAGSATGAKADEPAPTHKIRVSPHHTGRQAGPSYRRNVAAASHVTYRGLTVNRRPEKQDDADDILVDGPIRYGDIHSFNPVPYASSGQQFPYGFDGIGGYGSNLGIGAGQNASIYNSGP